MRNLKLSVRIAFSFAFVTILSTGIVAFAAYREMRPMLLEAVEITLIDTSRILASGLAESIESKGSLEDALVEFRQSLSRMMTTKFPTRNESDQSSHRQLRIFVTDELGKLRFDNQGRETPDTDFSRWRDIAFTLRGEYGARATRENPDDPTTSIHFIAAPVIAQGKLVGVVSIGKPVDSVATQVKRNKTRIALIFLLTLLLSIPLAYLASNLIARPVVRLKDYVERRALGEPALPPRLADDEIGALSKSFEDLRLKLEGKKYIESYVHNLTHEMKSPLTGILGASELLSRKESAALSAGAESLLIENIQSEAKRLHLLAERLLELASLEARATENLKKESFDLSLLIDEVLDSFYSQSQSLSLQLVNQCPENISLKAERFLVWQALANLIQNAIEFSNVEGARIVVRAESQDSEGLLPTIRIMVEDEGTGFPDYALQRASERFFSTERPRTKKKSSGLGLSFVKQVMSLHGGEFLVRNRIPRGALIELVFR